MIKAVIFDLNGVFIQSPKLSDRFKQSFNVSEKDFLPALKEVMAKVRIPDAGKSFSYWKPYLQKWGVNLSEKEFFNFWFSAEKEVLEMTALAREIKNKGIRIFILSNNFQERAEYYAKTFSFMKEIPEKVYYSWQTGFVKPDKRAYEFILKENNLNPNETMYFDDSEKNVKIANSIGIQSYLF